MYEVPAEPNADHIRRMVADLDWIMESVESQTGETRNDSASVHTKYKDVRNRLMQIHELLRREKPPEI